MSSTSSQQPYWLILATNSAPETAKIIGTLDNSDQGSLFMVEKLKVYRDCWLHGQLPSHDFMHRVKATIEAQFSPTVRAKARELIAEVLQNHRTVET
jgi:hypothetical protein